MTRPRLTVEALTYDYGPMRAVDGVSFQASPGELIAIMGRSGSGKSTILHLVAGLLSPASGAVFYDGQRYDDLKEPERSEFRLEHFGLVFQFGELIQELTLIENTALPLRARGVRKQAAEQRAQQALDRVGIGELASRFPDEVSGGQMQRCAIARAVVHRPGVVLADEPTGALDERTGVEVVGLLDDLRRDSACAVIVVTHDADVAAACDRIITVADGRVLSDDAADLVGPRVTGP